MIIKESVQYLVAIKGKLDKDHRYNLKISQLAKDAGVSESKLQHEFPKVYGISIQDYIIQARVNTAKELLCSYDNSIKRIARLVGYKNPESFIRVFKKRTGYTPNDYKKYSFLQAS